jgi:hypothetical protein
MAGTIEVLDKATEIQNECHATVGFIMDNQKNVSVQDATNVFLFRKLAELTLDIKEQSAVIDGLIQQVNNLKA